MSISPTLMLLFGSTAAALFFTLFFIALYITFRNRKIIQRHASPR